jgi:hypothetical protein
MPAPDGGRHLQWPDPFAGEYGDLKADDAKHSKEQARPERPSRCGLAEAKLGKQSLPDRAQGSPTRSLLVASGRLTPQ